MSKKTKKRSKQKREYSLKCDLFSEFPRRNYRFTVISNKLMIDGILEIKLSQRLITIFFDETVISPSRLDYHIKDVLAWAAQRFICYPDLRDDIEKPYSYTDLDAVVSVAT